MACLRRGRVIWRPGCSLLPHYFCPGRLQGSKGIDGKLRCIRSLIAAQWSSEPQTKPDRVIAPVGRRSYCKTSSITQDQIRELSIKNPTPLTLHQMKSYAVSDGKPRLMAAKFLHRELQIRFARSIVNLHELPLDLSRTKSIRSAITAYVRFLEELCAIPIPETMEDDLVFTSALKSIKSSGSNLVPLICHGIHEMKQSDLGQCALNMREVEDDIDLKLNEFFLSRIGIRMLMGQHIESLDSLGGRVQICNVRNIAEEACIKARDLCIKYMGDAPGVDIQLAKGSRVDFLYVQSHLHHMIFELVKNSMKATMELHPSTSMSESYPLKKLNHVMDIHSPLLDFVIPQEIGPGISIHPPKVVAIGGKLPPIRIVISQGSEDLTIKISDEAGGISRSRWCNVERYTYSTSSLYGKQGGSFREQFSGGGYGIPVARLFAQYFGGSITLISLEGYGTDAYIHVHKLGDKVEVVPGHADYDRDAVKY